MSMRQQGGRWAWWLAAPVAAVLAWLAWSWAGRPEAAPAEAKSAATAWGGASPFSAATASAASASAFARSRPLSPRELQLTMWQQRLERAQVALATYRNTTRYPHESRPLAEHPDQVHPNQPITEEQAFRPPGGKAAQGLKLRTLQERVFVQGSESVRFSVAVQDANGQLQPLRISRAVARQMPSSGAMANLAVVAMDFNDQGRAGDAQAADQVFGALLQPDLQGFGAGQIRVEVFMEAAGEQGATYFDIFYTPRAPALWQGGVREALQDGSLNFYLKADVREAGRYVVTARVDDATGKPFALLSFNDEVGTGPQEFRLSLFGRLVQDGQPAFPLTVRDVDGFLLRPDAWPDRSLVPPRDGVVHVTRKYPLAAFSDTAWTSDETRRYVTEYSKDVATAQAQVDQLGTHPGP